MHRHALLLQAAVSPNMPRRSLKKGPLKTRHALLIHEMMNNFVTKRKNFRGRAIYRGPRGGYYIIVNGRKRYSVRLA